MSDPIRFIESDLHDWALFSGDWNPIHFDYEVARKNGLDSPVVHGMLAMMKAKRLASSVMHGSEDVEINFSLRKPIPLGREIRYRLNRSEKRSSVSVIGDDKVEPYYFANIQSAGNPLSAIVDPNVYKNLDSKFIEDKWAQFSEKYPDMHFDWIFLDALIFAIYVDGNGGTSLAKDTRDFLGEEVNEKEFVVYQIGHKLTVSSELIGKVRGRYGDLAYSTKGIDLVRMSDSVYGSVEFYVFEDSEVIMKLEMGLMVKFRDTKQSSIDKN